MVLIGAPRRSLPTRFDVVSAYIWEHNVLIAELFVKLYRLALSIAVPSRYRSRLPIDWISTE